MIEIDGIKLETNKEVYIPSEDSFLLSENLKVKKGDSVLEIGTGSGIVSIYASKKAKKIIATDINFNAVELAEKNFKLNKIENIETRWGNLFEVINENEKFDIILFNTPYLPTDECEVLPDDLNYAFDGGADGRKVIDLFLKEVKNHLKHDGTVQLVQSSLSNNEKTIAILKKLGFKTEITAKEHFFFEDITVISGFLSSEHEKANKDNIK